MLTSVNGSKQTQRTGALVALKVSSRSGAILDTYELWERLQKLIEAGDPDLRVEQAEMRPDLLSSIVQSGEL